MVDDPATPDKDETDEGQLSEDDMESVVGGMQANVNVAGPAGVLGEAF